MLLQQRLASGSQASCSYISRPIQRSRAGTTARTLQNTRHQSRCSQVCRIAEVDDIEEMEMEEMPDTPYERMVQVGNIYPNYEDPEWIERVTDWEEFWHEDDDVLGVDDEDPSIPEVGVERLERAYQLAEQILDLRKRTDVEQIITNQVRPPKYYEQNFTSEEDYRAQMAMSRPDPNPTMSEIDARALAEKRRTRAMFDEEWERQTALLARPTSFTLRVTESNDFRFESAEFDWVRENWTHEQIEDLIIQGGRCIPPSQNKAVKILNPLVPVDFAESAVQAIPDTEDFIADIGHMATESEIMHLSTREITLEEKDFVDPGLVFEDNDGMVYQEAPVNRWAELQRLRDTQDLQLFEKVVDKMTEKQRKAEARRAAKEAAMAGEEGLAITEGAEVADDDAQEAEEGEEHWLDEIMGAGYTDFMEDDGNSVVLYGDLEPGDEENSVEMKPGLHVAKYGDS